jgi:sodium/potassium-transporting ATPase subunit alpha
MLIRLFATGSFSELMPVLLNVLFGMCFYLSRWLLVRGAFITTSGWPPPGLPQALSSIQMIIICVGTDVLPALSMVREKPEADLLLRKPRDRKKDRLADVRLISHAYFFIGVLQSLTAMTGYVLSPTRRLQMSFVNR